MPPIIKQMPEILSGHIAQGAIGSLALRIGSVVFALITSIVLARLLGAEGLGAYAFAQSIVEVLLVAVMLGLPGFLQREIPYAHQNDRRGLISPLVRQSLVLVFVFATAVSTLGALAVYYWWESFDPGMQMPLVVAFGMLPFLATLWVNESAVRASGKVITAQLPIHLYRPVLILLLVMALYITGWPLDAVDAMGINLIATLAALLISLLMWLRVKPGTDTNQPGDTWNLRRLLGSSLPFVLIAGLIAVNAQADSVALGILAGAEPVGLYRVAHRMASIAGFPYVALIISLGPAIAKLYAEQNLTVLRQRTNTAIGVGLSGAFAISVVLMVFSGFFLGLFGNEFRKADSAMLILCLTQTLTAVTAITQLMLAMCGKEKLVAVQLVIAVSLNILLNIILIPMHGLEGAASATLIATFVYTLLLLSSAQRELGFSPFLFDGLRR